MRAEFANGQDYSCAEGLGDRIVNVLPNYLPDVQALTLPAVQAQSLDKYKYALWLKEIAALQNGATLCSQAVYRGLSTLPYRQQTDNLCERERERGAAAAAEVGYAQIPSAHRCPTNFIPLYLISFHSAS
eukprot:1153345-Pelagomonas_calceolata.AAC.12